MKKFGKQTFVSFIAGIISVFFTYFLFIGPLERLNIDVLNYFFPSKASTSDVVVVGIDEISLFQLLTNNGHGQENFMQLL